MTGINCIDDWALKTVFRCLTNSMFVKFNLNQVFSGDVKN